MCCIQSRQLMHLLLMVRPRSRSPTTRSHISDKPIEELSTLKGNEIFARHDCIVYLSQETASAYLASLQTIYASAAALQQGTSIQAEGTILHISRPCNNVQSLDGHSGV